MTPSTTTNCVTSFLSTLRLQVPPFVQAMEQTLLQKYNLDVSRCQADHVCWRTETWDEYSELVGQLKEDVNICQLLTESNIGGRPITTIYLVEGIYVPCAQATPELNRTIHVIEIPSPKKGSPYKRGLEHVEFVIDATAGDGMHQAPLSPLNGQIHQSTFDNFMFRYPLPSWNIKAKMKEINPDIGVKIDLEDFGECSVKFHLVPLAKVIEYEGNH